jgi:hypothetical protein
MQTHLFLNKLQAKNVEVLRPSKFIQVVIIYKVGGLNVYLSKTQTLQPSTLSSYLATGVKFQNGVLFNSCQYLLLLLYSSPI